MKIKLFLIALLAIAAITWQACEKSPLNTNLPGIDQPATDRGIVVFNDVTPPTTVSGHQLTWVQLYGGANGRDTIRVRSAGILDVTVLGYNNTCYLNTDTLAAKGFTRDSTFICPTTAAFRNCLPSPMGTGTWDATIVY